MLEMLEKVTYHYFVEGGGGGDLQKDYSIFLIISIVQLYLIFILNLKKQYINYVTYPVTGLIKRDINE